VVSDFFILHRIQCNPLSHISTFTVSAKTLPPPIQRPPADHSQIHSDNFDNFLRRLAFAWTSTLLFIDKWKRWTTLSVEKNYTIHSLSTKLACCIDIWKKCQGKSRFLTILSHNLVQIWNAKPQSSEFHHWKILPSLPVPYNQIWEPQSKLLGWLIHWIFANWSILGTANIRRKGQFLETMILRKRFCSFGLQFDNKELLKFVTRNLSFSLISLTFCVLNVPPIKLTVYILIIWLVFK